jgi:energy-coupling factor transporter transmembrane protein EcfT
MKLLELSLWSIIALSSPPAVMGLAAVILIILLGISGTRISRLKKPLLFWSVMALTITITAGLSGAAAGIEISGRVLPFSREGLYSGMLRSARLLTVLMAGQLLSATTDPADLSAAVRKILFFLPSSWSSAMAAAISLTLAFIPQILDEAGIIRDAAFSRALGSRRSPLRRSVSLGLPLAEATLRRADSTTEALLSRCYSENPTPPELRLKIADILKTLAVILPLLILRFIVLSFPK